MRIFLQMVLGSDVCVRHIRVEEEDPVLVIISKKRQFDVIWAHIILLFLLYYVLVLSLQKA